MKTIYYTRLGVLLIFFLLVLEKGFSQNLGCNYKPGDIVLTLTGQTTGSSISSQVILIDANQIIRYKSLVNQTKLFNVAIGSYKAIAITFDNTQQPLVEIGKNIDEINNCLKSVAVPLNICDCNSSENFISASLQVKGENQKFVLTNGKGVIQQIANTPYFQGITNGVYNLYVACSGINQPISGMIIGGSIGNIATANLCMETPLSYVVCLSECKVELCIPYTIIKTKKAR
jgi:hypothetical protein